MRHRKKSVKLGRTREHRRALFRNLLTSLILNGRIITTDAKAKELKRIADRVINLGKKGDLHSIRLAAREVIGPDALDVLFKDLPKKFSKRNSGFTRIVKIGNRKGDCAPMSLIEILPSEVGIPPQGK